MSRDDLKWISFVRHYETRCLETFKYVDGKAELVKSTFLQAQVAQRELSWKYVMFAIVHKLDTERLTLSNAIVYLVHIQVLDVRSEDPIEQLHTMTESNRRKLRLRETTHNIQDLFSWIQPPHRGQALLWCCIVFGESELQFNNMWMWMWSKCKVREFLLPLALVGSSRGVIGHFLTRQPVVSSSHVTEGTI
jgi:hypothetical protein